MCDFFFFQLFVVIEGQSKNTQKFYDIMVFSPYSWFLTSPFLTSFRIFIDYKQFNFCVFIVKCS